MGQRPLPVCPSPASFVRQFVRALCSGVLRHSPGRVGVVCLDKKQVGAGTDMSVVSALLGAGALPGGYVRGNPLMCAFYLAFCTSKKQAVRPDGTGHPVPPAAHLSKKVRCCTAAQKEPPPVRGRTPRIPCRRKAASLLKRQRAAQLHSSPSGTPARYSAYTPAWFRYNHRGRCRPGWRRCRA